MTGTASSSSSSSSSIYLYVLIALSLKSSSCFNSSGSYSILYSKMVSPRMVTLLFLSFMQDLSIDFLSISFNLQKLSYYSSSSSASDSESEEISCPPCFNRRCSISVLKAEICKLSGLNTCMVSRSLSARFNLFF